MEGAGGSGGARPRERPRARGSPRAAAHARVEATRAALAPARRRARAAARAGGLEPRRTPPGETALIAVKAALAAGLAWAAAQAVTGEGAPVFAPLAALLAVQVSVRRSLGEVVPRVLALLAGVLVAVAVAEAVELSVVAVVVIVGVSVLAGGVLRLPAAAATQVPVTGLLLVVLGGGGVRAAELRVVDGLVGLVVGIVVNALVVPPLGLEEARRRTRDGATAVAELLADLAAGLPGRTTPPEALAWLQRARRTDAQVELAVAAVADAAEAHRWNPRAAGTEARVERLREATAALSHVALQVRGVARTAADLARTAQRRPGSAVVLPDGYRRACAAVGDAVDAFGHVVASDHPLDSADGRRLLMAVADASDAWEALSDVVLEPGTGAEALLVHGSLLADLRRAVLELDPVAGEHRGAVRRPHEDVGDEDVGDEDDEPGAVLR